MATTATERFVASDMRHSRSEDLLGAVSSRSPSPITLQTTASEDDLIAASALRDSCSSTKPSRSLMIPRIPGSPGILADRIDPEDSIRDIVTENDLYRFVLFKRHYDKYVALSAKYEEAKGLAYYLEERYHEVKAERDKLEETRRELEEKLEGCETELRGKEDELFLQLERNLGLEEEVERARVDRDDCLAERNRLDHQREVSLRRLEMQLAQNEITRRTLERARQEVIEQATIIRQERDALERENNALKQKLRVKRDELGAERRRREDGVAALTRETITLRHAARHLQAATLHATSCRRRRRCSVCLYARRTFAEIDDFSDPGHLFKCLEAPLQDLRSWLRPAAGATAGSSNEQQTVSSMAVGALNYIDDSSSSSTSSSADDPDDRDARGSSSSSNSASDDEAYPATPVPEISLSSATSTAPPTARAFSSDSGFSSEVGDRRSRNYENGARPGGGFSSGASSRKVSESLSGGEAAEHSTPGGFSRSKWTSSFRRLLGRTLKPKSLSDRST
ncbi:inner centromere protein-like [Prorops nasuta]|uniref:inner centromere protein-like n=1 Tax=Prorops nasuta TaxID=863751 RepID=UPI0034CDE5B6